MAEKINSRPPSQSVGAAPISNAPLFDRTFSRKKSCTEYMESYKGHIYAADAMTKHLKNKYAKILDFGAGSGEVGQMLYDKGYKNLDAVEGSYELSEQAKSLKVYQNVYHETCQLDQPLEKVHGETYDAVVCADSIGPGELDSNHLKVFLKCIKRGGLVFIGVRDEHLSYDKIKHDEPDWEHNVEEAMMRMKKERKWVLIDKIHNEEFAFGNKGYTFCFKKL